MFNDLPADIKNIIFTMNREQSQKDKYKKIFQKECILDLLERFTVKNRKGKIFIREPEKVLHLIRLDKDYNILLHKNHAKETIKNYRYEKNNLIWKM
jgi:hypothetical protein